MFFGVPELKADTVRELETFHSASRKADEAKARLASLEQREADLEAKIRVAERLLTSLGESSLFLVDLWL